MDYHGVGDYIGKIGEISIDYWLEIEPTINNRFIAIQGESEIFVCSSKQTASFIGTIQTVDQIRKRIVDSNVQVSHKSHSQVSDIPYSKHIKDKHPDLYQKLSQDTLAIIEETKSQLLIQSKTIINELDKYFKSCMDPEASSAQYSVAINSPTDKLIEEAFQNICFLIGRCFQDIDSRFEIDSFEQNKIKFFIKETGQYLVIDVGKIVEKIIEDYSVHSSLETPSEQVFNKLLLSHVDELPFLIYEVFKACSEQKMIPTTLTFTSADSHLGYRPVTVELIDGKKWVYKPRSLNTEHLLLNPQDGLFKKINDHL